MAQAGLDDPADFIIINAERNRHGQLHVNTKARKIFDDSLANFDGIGPSHRAIGSNNATIELQENHQLVSKRCEATGHVVFRECDAVRRKINFFDALLVKKGNHLPKFRMQNGLAPGELNGVQPIFEVYESRQVSLELLEWQLAIAPRVAVAHGACEIASIGHFDEDSARFIVHLISELCIAIVAATAGITARVEFRKSHRLLVVVAASPTVFVREMIELFVIFHERLGRAVLSANFANQNTFLARED